MIGFEQFVSLLHTLYFTSSTNAKKEMLAHFFKTTPCPCRGVAAAVLTRQLSFKSIKRRDLKPLLETHVDDYLIALSYDYVGDMSETVAHLWPETPSPTNEHGITCESNAFTLSALVDFFELGDREAVLSALPIILSSVSYETRWTILKIITGGLRIGVSDRLVKQSLALWSGETVESIDLVWHATKPPYQLLMSWLSGEQPKPELGNLAAFHPMMLAHPLDSATIAETDITPEQFAAEWKYDGIRAQLVVTTKEAVLFSRTGERLCEAFPDLLKGLSQPMVLDGELLVMNGESLGSFNDLQQRLNRKKPTASLMRKHPAVLMVYDCLSVDGNPLTEQTFLQRRQELQKCLTSLPGDRFKLSPLIDFTDKDNLNEKRLASDASSVPVEGVMLKRFESPYLMGRVQGHWYKWKRDPFYLDTVMLYAQRGHGKRSSLYSDYTFGVWEGDKLVPIGKAYSGFTDEELKWLDKFVRTHTIKRFGPVREVEKTLVLEVAFDAIAPSPRHKSGVALRFPRIHRIRKDKLAKEADDLATAMALMHGCE